MRAVLILITIVALMIGGLGTCFAKTAEVEQTGLLMVLMGVVAFAAIAIIEQLKKMGK